MRKAGDLIAEYLREGKLTANRSEPIGTGNYGVVYESDVPGKVMKQMTTPDVLNTVVKEADLQSIAADAGMAPRISGVETFPGGIGNRIEMQDVRTNFESHGPDGMWPGGKDAIRINQQLGELALKGVRLEDRHSGNVVYNKMTGRPMHLDFGIGGRVEGSQQVATLAAATSDGFTAAGLSDVASIYRATVMDLLEGGDVADAMDVAKQGFAQLQKIKGPIEQPVPMFNAVTKKQLT
jgi:hypothetical protein